jgi:hypothetical protein
LIQGKCGRDWTIEETIKSTFRARLIIICSAFSSWYLAILASIAATSIPSIKLNAAGRKGEKFHKNIFLKRYRGKHKSLSWKLTHVFDFLQIIVVLFQRWKIIFTFIESINLQSSKQKWILEWTPKSESPSLEYDTYFFSTKDSNTIDFQSNEKTKILMYNICSIMNSKSEWYDWAVGIWKKEKVLHLMSIPRLLLHLTNQSN